MPCYGKRESYPKRGINMKWYVVKLKFLTPVHFGHDEPGIGIESVQTLLHADTIFSALCNVWARFHILTREELEGLGNIFNTSPPFRLSSAFPYMFKSTRLKFYLPKPHIDTRQFEIFGDDMIPHRKTEWKKQLKNVQFIPSEFFENWLKEEQFIKDGWLEDLNAWQGSFVEEIHPHHAQDRLTQASELYHSGKIFFHQEQEDDCGFYFLVQFPEEDNVWKEKLNEALMALSTMGLGGDKSLGLGRFEYNITTKHGVLEEIDRWDDLEFLKESAQEEKDKKCVLSLFWPTESERKSIVDILNVEDKKNNSIAYGLVQRKGWTGSTSTLHKMKRKTMTMFSEGSVFGVEGFSPQGSIIDIKPVGFPHPVWRYGIALTVPIMYS